MNVIRELAEIFALHDIDAEILAASIRHPLHMTQAALAGAHIATLPFKVLQQMVHHPLTDKGIVQFRQDWEKARAEASRVARLSVMAHALCGGAVLSRTTSSVASSTRVCAGCSPRARRRTSSAAATAISISGWRTVVRGGLTQRATGRSSKPTTLRSSGMCSRSLARGLVDAERLEVVAGDDRRRGIRRPKERAALVDALVDVERAVADELGIDRHAGLVHGRAEAVEAGAAAQDLAARR